MSPAATASASTYAAPTYEAFEAATELFVDFSLRIVGVDRDVKLTAMLCFGMSRCRSNQTSTGHMERPEGCKLEQWKIPQNEDDPWGGDERPVELSPQTPLGRTFIQYRRRSASPSNRPGVLVVKV